jgi:hypothetical protein
MAEKKGLVPIAICMGVLKLDGSGLPEVRLIYMYVKLRAPSLIIPESSKVLGRGLVYVYPNVA